MLFPDSYPFQSVISSIDCISCSYLPDQLIAKFEEVLAMIEIFLASYNVEIQNGENKTHQKHTISTVNILKNTFLPTDLNLQKLRKFMWLSNDIQQYFLLKVLLLVYSRYR